MNPLHPNRRRFLSMSAAGLLSSTISGCGGGGGDGDTAAAVSGGPVTPVGATERQAALDAIATKFDTLPHTSMDADNAAMLTYLRTLPALRSLQLTSTGTIAGQFIDGSGFVFINNLDETGEVVPASVPAGVENDVARAQAVSELPIGATGKVVLLNGVGLGFTSGGGQFVMSVMIDLHLNKLRDMFQRKNYNVSKDYATVKSFRDLRDVDVLYFNGHSGFGIAADGKTQIYVISTSQPTDLKTTDAALLDDIANHRAGYLVLASNTASGRRSSPSTT